MMLLIKRMKSGECNSGSGDSDDTDVDVMEFSDD